MTHGDFCDGKVAFFLKQSAVEATFLAWWVGNTFAHCPGLYPLLLTLAPVVDTKSKCLWRIA